MQKNHEICYCLSDPAQNGKKNGAVNGTVQTNGHVSNGNSNGTNSPVKENNPNTIKLIETLFNINISVERGKLIGVCGSIGSGKSSLISAICGDVRFFLY